MPSAIDVNGQRFGRFLVTGPASPSAKGRRRVMCQCDCGTVKAVEPRWLRSGDSAIRVQLSRKKGWKMPPNTMMVSRPSRWGNPHRVGADETYYGGPGHEAATAEQCVALYRRGIEAHASAERRSVESYLATLRGWNLACWCALDAPCHADVLIELANRPVCDDPAARSPEGGT